MRQQAVGMQWLPLLVAEGDMAQEGGVDDGVHGGLLVAGQFGDAAHAGTGAGREGDSGHGENPVG